MSDLSLSAALSAAKPELRPLHAKDEASAQKAATDFEAVFLNEMLGAMFEGVQTDGPFGGGAGEGMFRSLMVDQYARTIAKQGGIGIAHAVKGEILRLQEAAR